MRTHKNKRRRISLNAEINVVPYIDVMMVLLVIFMVTAPLLTQGVEVDLPKAVSDPVDIEDNTEPLIVSVSNNGSYYLELGENNRQPITLERVGVQVSKILKRVPTTQVLIRGDKNVDYGVVVALMSILQQAGAESVGLVSEIP